MTRPIDPRARAAVTDALRYAQSWLRYRAWHSRVPGVQWAVWFDDGVQASGASGLADIATAEPMTERHLFRVASHSKTFTATVVLQLVERGQLRLDDTVARHVPEFDGTELGAVTVRELLEHAGGVVRDGSDSDHWQHARPFPDEEHLFALLRDHGIKNPPQTAFAYSNLGYSLLGTIIRRASGSSFADHLRDEIAAPLGLSDTAADYLTARAAEYATGYSGLHTARERMPIPHVPTNAMDAATGVTSTAADLVRYFAAHRIGTGELLPDAAKRAQQRILWQTEADGESGYGLGLVVQKVAGRRVIGHSGGYPGHITMSLVAPDDGIAVSVLTNAIDGPAHDLAVGVLTILYAALDPAAQPSLRLPADPPGDTSRFEGRFANLWGVLDVFRLGDRLLAQSPTGAAPLERVTSLEVVDEHTLRVADGDGYGSVGELLHYEFGEDGRPSFLRGAGGMSYWPFDPEDTPVRVPWVG